MQKDDPAAYAKLEAEAAANSKQRLRGSGKSRKMASSHPTCSAQCTMTDPRVIDLTPEARTAFDGAGTVVIESTDILDEKKAAMAMLSTARHDHVHRPDDADLAA